MVDDEAARQAPDLRLALGERAAVELHHRVPAESVHARGERVHHVPSERAAGERHEADAADSAAGELRQMRVGRAGFHDADALRARPEPGDRISTVNSPGGFGPPGACGKRAS